MVVKNSAILTQIPKHLNTHNSSVFTFVGGLLVHREVVVSLDVGIHDCHHFATVLGHIGLHLQRIGEHALVPLWTKNEINKRIKQDSKAT